ncbi:MAG: VOC family protein [Microbacteriaceae bacterium]|nr:VOC family protein [Microbacteriaceae bacterium]
MGSVTLLVSDLDGMTAWYRDSLGLQVFSAEGGRVTLGRGTVSLLVLEHQPTLTQAALGSAGLFHTAILFDTQASLALAIESIATSSPQSYTGCADHLVSQAFYFTDPEGNGVELYWDRARAEWSWANGQIEMASLPLDPNVFLHEHLPGAVKGASNGAGPRASVQTSSVAVVGHVHLAVGDIASAHEFYVTKVGFEQTIALGNQALFVSAGGYHHHMAMNVWGSRGAGPRPRALGLGRVDIVVPTLDDLGALEQRMLHHRVATRNDGAGLSFKDPWANLVRVSVAG